MKVMQCIIKLNKDDFEDWEKTQDATLWEWEIMPKDFFTKEYKNVNDDEILVMQQTLL